MPMTVTFKEQTMTRRTGKRGASLIGWIGGLAILGGSVASAQQPPAPPQTWTGQAGAGVALTSGNSDTLTYNLAFDLTRDPKTRNVIKMNGLYLRGEQNDELTVNRT